MLTIRLKRMGRKNRPYFRVVVAEQQRSPSSTYIEKVGYFDPRDKEKTLVLDTDRIVFWMQKGAQVSGTVHNMLVHKGVIKAGKRKVTRAKKQAATASADVPVQPTQSVATTQPKD